jgi:hypothetical protein
MLKVNTVMHTLKYTINSESCHSEHELGSLIPYLETNRLRPRIRAIQKSRPIAYRTKVLGRALLATRTNANILWMLLSGNPEVAFPSKAAANLVPTPATTTTTATTIVASTVAASVISSLTTTATGSLPPAAATSAAIPSTTSTSLAFDSASTGATAANAAANAAAAADASGQKRKARLFIRD